MKRIDITRLRKDHKMSQNELARRLSVAQSFMSAIENGRSTLPHDKEHRLREIFADVDMEKYTVDSDAGKDMGPESLTASETNLMTRLLAHFHEHAHSIDDEAHHQEHHERLAALEEQLGNLIGRLTVLLDRNDELSRRNEALTKQVLDLSAENERLRAALNAGK